MKHNRKPLRLCLVFLLAVLCVALTVPAFANNTPKPPPAYYAEASTPDENGYFDFTVSAENLDFLVSELAFRYDPKIVRPVNIETGEAAAEFADFSEAFAYNGLVRIGEKLDTEQGFFLFTMFTNVGASGENIRDQMLYFEKKSPLYRFRFQKIAEGDMAFSIASIYDGGVYDKIFPDGAVVMSAVNDRHVCDVVITSDGETKKTQTVYYYYSELYPKNYTKEQRLQNTVYLVMNDYAAATDGVLCAIDPQNKEVTPFYKDDKAYYPLRFLCESFGLQVEWEESTGKVTVFDKDGAVAGIVDTIAQTVTVGETVTESCVEMSHDRTMVTKETVLALCGIRAFAENEYIVFYDSIPEWTPGRSAEKEALEAMQYVFLPFFRMFI